MARTRKTPTVEIVATTVETDDVKKTVGSESSETVAIAVRLPLGLKFDDVPNGKGGVKDVVFPGVNDHLKGKKEGILLADSGAICVNILRRDWEAILAMHGNEAVFKPNKELPPCIWEMGTIGNFKARKDETAEMRHGLEPAKPSAMGVKKAE